MTSGLSSVGTAAPTPKCLLRSTAAAGAGARHASVLVLDLILMPNTFQRLSYAALKLCSTRSSQPHRAHPVPAAQSLPHLNPHLRPHLHLLTHPAHPAHRACPRLPLHAHLLTHGARRTTAAQNAPHRAHPVPAACRTCTRTCARTCTCAHHCAAPARRTERTQKTRRTPDRIIQLPPNTVSIVAPVRQILILGSWVRAPGARTRTVRAPEPPYGNSQLLISKS